MKQTPVTQILGCEVFLGSVKVIKNMNLSIPPGQFVALLGANGSGKTTLVRAMLGLLPTARGEVRLFGTPLAQFRRWGRIGFVPQRFGAVSPVPATVEEIVLTGRIARAGKFRRFSAGDRSAALAALEAVGLGDLSAKRIAALSGGQQQRVLIARALVNDPEFLVLDEPVSNVDLASQHSFARTLQGLAESRRTVLLLAHELGEMRPLVERTIVLEHGEIAYDGAPGADHLIAHVHHHHEPPEHPEHPEHP